MLLTTEKILWARTGKNAGDVVSSINQYPYAMICCILSILSRVICLSPVVLGWNEPIKENMFTNSLHLRFCWSCVGLKRFSQFPICIALGSDFLDVLTSFPKNGKNLPGKPKHMALSEYRVGTPKSTGSSLWVLLVLLKLPFGVVHANFRQSRTKSSQTHQQSWVLQLAPCRHVYEGVQNQFARNCLILCHGDLAHLALHVAYVVNRNAGGLGQFHGDLNLQNLPFILQIGHVSQVFKCQPDLGNTSGRPRHSSLCCQPNRIESVHLAAAIFGIEGEVRTPNSIPTVDLEWQPKATK